jgi:hypothetical protein
VRGPHCPKCGCSSAWEIYSGPATDPDALHCTALSAGRTLGDTTEVIRCAYIYWLKNAPDNSPIGEVVRDTIKNYADTPTRAKRSRVRALVLAMMNSGLKPWDWDNQWNAIINRFQGDPLKALSQEHQEEINRLRGKSVVDIAIEIDEAIEAIGAHA